MLVTIRNKSNGKKLMEKNPRKGTMLYYVKRLCANEIKGS
jgi:hypothetical protein